MGGKATVIGAARNNSQTHRLLKGKCVLAFPPDLPMYSLAASTRNPDRVWPWASAARSMASNTRWGTVMLILFARTGSCAGSIETSPPSPAAEISVLPMLFDASGGWNRQSFVNQTFEVQFNCFLGHRQRIVYRLAGREAAR